MWLKFDKTKRKCWEKVMTFLEIKKKKFGIRPAQKMCGKNVIEFFKKPW